jgi:small subunit ribosomal protein S7
MVKACNVKAGRTIEERFAREVLDVLKGESSVLKKKDDVHTLAMVNRCVSYTRFRVTVVV